MFARRCWASPLWSRIDERRTVFVTDDGNFHKDMKKPALIELGADRIERPDSEPTGQGGVGWSTESRKPHHDKPHCPDR